MSRLICWIGVLVFILFASPTAAKDDPLLVIDPQGHGSVVWDVMFTPDGERLISVSEDKTIRVWDVETGDLLNTIRGQIDPEHGGQLYAGALSPDGKMLAVGGILGTAETYGQIRLLHPDTGEQFAVLEGHAWVVADLAFSPDGKWLASGGGDNTIKIWDITGIADRAPAVVSPVATLTGHTNAVYSVVFSPDGKQLVSGAYDGTVRLWTLPEQFNQFVRSKRMTGHTDGLRSVRFSPDGSYIVSGALDGKILLWDNAGEFLKEIDQIPYGVMTMAFSADGHTLMVGGVGPQNGHLYDIPSGDKIGMFTEHNNSIHPSAFYGNEWIATSGGNAHEIFVWEAASGRVKTRMAGQNQLLWPVGIGAGGQIAFGTSWEGTLTAAFDLAALTLTLKPPADGEFAFSQTSYQGKTLQSISEYELAITNGGNILTDRDQQGRILSYTFTPDGDVVVGTDYRLMLYRSDGTLVRDFVGHTVHIWTVAVSPDGQRLVSAADDGTVKVWNLHTGECLATLFVATDHEWVCWTPQGYYEASAGGEKYIGWHLNQGIDKTAQYYPVSVFRKQFHQPELVKRTVAEGSFEHALQACQAESQCPIEESPVAQILPPTVQWFEPAPGTLITEEAQVRVRAQIQSDSPLTQVKVLVNGRAPKTGRGLSLGGTSVSPDNLIDQEIALIPGKNEITIFAANANAGASSEKRTVLFRSPEHTPDLYLVAIGISRYDREELSLEYADDDAQAVSRVFLEQEGKLYNKVIIKQLYDTDATQANIVAALTWLEDQVTQKDVALIFMAAHGINAAGKYYLVPADVNPDELPNTSVSWSVFAEILGRLPSKVLLVLDTCHSGQLGQNVQAEPRQADNTEAIRTLASDEYGVVILAASTGQEFSLEEPAWGHGAFTKALIEALQEGRADYSNDGEILLRELDLYLAERVEALTNGEQHPTTQKPSTISRFPILQVR